ncbi:hypothetical protein ABGT23_01955 [Enterobacter cloacae]|uniref:hypothetical protein n=1 Tax=Enterobacter cloacae TaxID=550 RepID=UPI00345C8757
MDAPQGIDGGVEQPTVSLRLTGAEAEAFSLGMSTHLMVREGYAGFGVATRGLRM